MKTFTTFALLSLALSCAFAAHADASEVSYRMSIDGSDPNEMFLPFLTPGTHALWVEVIVTDNDLDPSENVFNAGIFQSLFDLSTDNGGFTFVDVAGGAFGGSSNGKWDSDDLIGPFDTHNRGVTDNGGGPTVIAEGHTVSPSNYGAKIQAIGANVWSVAAHGEFVYDGGEHPLHLELVVFTPFGGDIVVGAFDGTKFVGTLPDAVNNASISFIPEPTTSALALAALCLVMGRRRAF